MIKVLKLRCVECSRLVNTLILQKCFKCYNRSRKPIREAKKGATEKIRLYCCLDGRRKFDQDSEPKFKYCEYLVKMNK